MESLPEDNMVERQEAEPQTHLEVPYVTIVRNIVHEKIPEHAGSFDITLDEINRQLIEGNGFFQWESKAKPGVKFLAGHLSITPDLIQKIASQNMQNSDESLSNQDLGEDEQRLEHYVYFVQPSFGPPPDGSAISALDMGIDRFIKEMPKVARAMRAGEKPPTVDIFIVGGPTALGAQVTGEFIDEVKKDGFEPYAKIYAEFAEEFLPKDKETLEKTRIVLQGVSKGTVTSDLTTKYLPKEIQDRTQRLYDDTAASHGRNIPTQIGRSINMGVGMAAEIGVRQFKGTVRNAAFAGQKQFYEEISKLRHLEDSEEQAKLKGELFTQELKTVAKGTPLNTEQRAYSRISTPDPVNINIRNIGRVIGAGLTEKFLGIKSRITGRELAPRRALVANEKGRLLTFATSNTFHNFPWERSIESGSWAQKMEYVENTKTPVAPKAT